MKIKCLKQNFPDLKPILKNDGAERPMKIKNKIKLSSQKQNKFLKLFCEKYKRKS